MFDKEFLTKGIAFVVILLIVWGLNRVNRAIFRKIEARRQGIHLRFFERIVTVSLYVVGFLLAFSVFGGFSSIWTTVLGGTAIISGIIAFAAQDVIKDILAGLMISLYKPFELGNRIELENGTTGIVKDITMRHVVIQTLDTQRVVIPNSKLNTMSLKNYSYHAAYRSAQMVFHVAYGTDVEKAMQVIRDAILSSEHSITGKEVNDGLDYAPIYFLAYEDSSLKLATTVYYNPTSPSEVVISDINLRVGKALGEAGIEIPFNYINVVQKD